MTTPVPKGITTFIPNGIVTYEECAECREPDIKVEHGKDLYGYPMHFEHCPECGDSMPLLCFDCPDCETVTEVKPNEQDKTCTWKRDGRHWETECGDAFQFADGGPQDNNMRFCPYCGRKLKQE